MTSPAAPPSASPLLQALDASHQQARAALTAQPPRVMDAVMWLSTHLAARERVIAPRARRAAPGQVRRTDRSLARRLERLLRVAERRDTGDALVAHVDGGGLVQLLLAALDEHARAEERLVTAMRDTVGAGEQEALAQAYRATVEQAPTRPHPHVPHGRLLGGVAFRVEALRDRIRDTMDSRAVPTPRRQPTPVEPGLWGHYLLGEPEPGRRQPVPRR